MTVNRWVFNDGAGELYTVPINPNKMSKLKAARAITTNVTTALAGQTLFFEGRRPPQAWQFSGVLLDKGHYDALDHWVYSKGRITITDQFLRVLRVVLTDFDAAPVAGQRRLWRHEYTCSGLLYDVDATNAVDPGPIGA